MLRGFHGATSRERMPTVSDSSTPSAGLRRDLDLLRELASEEALRRGGLGVVRLAELLGRDKSQVSRALRALEAEGMVERDARTRTFQLGWGIYALAARGVHTRLVHTAAIRLRPLAEDRGRVALLCVLVDGQVRTVLSVAPGGSGQLDGVDPLAALPVSGCAAGAALVVDWVDGVEGVPVGGPEQRERIDTIRTVGHVAVTSGRAGVAAPVRDFRGTVVAAVELAPDLHGNVDGGEQVERVAGALSSDLGFEPSAMTPLFS